MAVAGPCVCVRVFVCVCACVCVCKYTVERLIQGLFVEQLISIKIYFIYNYKYLSLCVLHGGKKSTLGIVLIYSLSSV